MNKTLKLCLGVALTSMCLLLIEINRSLDGNNSDKSTQPLDRRKSTINILYWTPMFRQVDFNLGLGSKIFQDCTYKNCYATNDRTLFPIEDFDAILFHGIEYNEAAFGIPQKRSPEQIYIFSNQESPIYTPHFVEDFNSNFYNWTMTYRLDSDVMRPYGFLVQQETTYQPPTLKDIQGRPKKIAWFVSNCGTSSYRELLHINLGRFFPIDVYGNCGNLTCPRKVSDGCYKMLEDQYKFYLSFENSVCKDYVTEKLYNLLKLNIVPIVYGGADYDQIAPPHSVIDVTKFDTIESLVEYIKFLDENHEEYLRYFEWKKHFLVDTSNKLVLCSLCEKLNGPVIRKTYSNILEWWRGASKCASYSQMMKLVFHDS